MIDDIHGTILKAKNNLKMTEYQDIGKAKWM